MKDVIQLHRNGDQINLKSLPWLLTEQQINFVKQVIQKIKFPIGFCSNINNIITRKGDFAGVKMHDWHVFIMVIIMVYIYIYLFISIYFYSRSYKMLVFVCPPFEKIMKQNFILLHYVLPSSLP